ncbi:unnamed protein product, partial [Mesorhabditis spiculigera]
MVSARKGGIYGSSLLIASSDVYESLYNDFYFKFYLNANYTIGENKMRCLKFGRQWAYGPAKKEITGQFHPYAGDAYYKVQVNKRHWLENRHYESCTARMYGTAPCIVHGTDAHDPADDQFYLKFYLRAKYTQGANEFRCVHFHDPIHFGADRRANITGNYY